MAIDLNRMRDFKHEDNLLKEKQEQPSPPSKEEQIVELVKSVLPEVEKVNEKKSKAGRPQKNSGVQLKSRMTVLLSKEQREIIERRRGAGRLGSIDSSSFIREWLVNSGMFDTDKNPILESPLANLETPFKK